MQCDMRIHEQETIGGKPPCARKVSGLIARHSDDGTQHLFHPAKKKTKKKKMSPLVYFQLPLYCRSDNSTAASLNKK